MVGGKCSGAVHDHVLSLCIVFLLQNLKGRHVKILRLEAQDPFLKAAKLSLGMLGCLLQGGYQGKNQNASLGFMLIFNKNDTVCSGSKNERAILLPYLKTSSET